MEFSFYDCFNWTSLCVLSNIKIFKLNKLKNQIKEENGFFRKNYAKRLSKKNF
jgi:hypothetical protein